jgi:hypothetical protein
MRDQGDGDDDDENADEAPKYHRKFAHGILPARRPRWRDSWRGHAHLYCDMALLR